MKAIDARDGILILQDETGVNLRISGTDYGVYLAIFDKGFPRTNPVMVSLDQAQVSELIVALEQWIEYGRLLYAETK